MNGFALLGLAICGEVFASSMLKASKGFKRAWPVIGLLFGYTLAFYGLSMALESIPLGLAYAIWAGVGTAFTAIIGIIFYNELFTIKKLLGIILIIFGVVFLNLS